MTDVTEDKPEPFANNYDQMVKFIKQIRDYSCDHPQLPPIECRSCAAEMLLREIGKQKK